MIRASFLRAKNIIYLFIFLLFSLLAQEISAQGIELPANSRKMISQVQKCPTCPESAAEKFVSETYEAELSLDKLKQFYDDKLSNISLTNKTTTAQGGYQYSWMQDNKSFNLTLLPNPANPARNFIVYVHPKDIQRQEMPETKTLPLNLEEVASKLSAKLITTRDFFVNGKKLNLKHYATLYPYPKVKEHYKQELLSKDWILQSAANEDLLVFMQAGQYITVGKLLSQIGRTEFIVTQGEIPYAGEGTAKQKEPLFLPQDAGLKQINYIQDKTGKSIYITYEYNKDFSQAVSFYTYKMQALGWELKDSREFSDFGTELSEGIAQDELGKSFKDKKATLLKFKAKNADCSVNVLELKDKNTFIQVRYEAK